MTSTNDTPERNDLHRTDDRIDLLLVPDGVLVYEPGNPAAWLESDEWVPLAERR
jgi:hypothetical protein